MELLPTVGFNVHNGFLLILPLLFIRLAIPLIIKRNTSSKLDYFPPVRGVEKTALTGYFITNNIVLFLPLICLLRLSNMTTFILFSVMYGLGILLLLCSVCTFSKDHGLTTNGIYRYSRNPMYLGYFFLYIGVGLALQSILYLLLVILYQICVHYLILSEERWCIETYQNSYLDYMKDTNRYFGRS